MNPGRELGDLLAQLDRMQRLEPGVLIRGSWKGRHCLGFGAHARGA